MASNGQASAATTSCLGANTYPRSPAGSPPPSAMRKPATPSPLSHVAATGGDSPIPPHHPPGALHPPTKKQVHLSTEQEENNTPLFIHSVLDKHGSLQGWLRSKHEQLRDRSQQLRDRGREPISAAPLSINHKRRPGAPKPLTPAHPDPIPKALSPPLPDSDSDASSMTSRLDGTPVFDESIEGYDYDSDEEDDHHGGSLSRQLAETAQGVREVSKTLSRTRVHTRIQTVLIVTKARDNRLIALTRELAMHLMLRKPAIPASAASSSTDVRSPPRHPPNERGMIVYVDAQLRHSKRFDAKGLQEEYPQLFEPMSRKRSASMGERSTMSLNSMSSSWSSAQGNGHGSRSEEGQLRFWTPEMCSKSPQLFDFVVTLGGDGTVLFTSWLFQRIVPPVLPFALGSLGFLTNFDFSDCRKTMDKCIDEGIRVNLRMRFTCTVYRALAPDASVVVGRHGKRKAIRRPGGEILINAVDQDGWEALEGGTPCSEAGSLPSNQGEKEILCFSTRPVEQFEVLNDLVVDRGPSPFVSFLEVFGDDHHLTTVQADGLTVSTPTGSTAYSLSAGGSLVHPGIPAMLMTPICPHTLSFRPMLLPDGMELRVCVPYNSRSTAWASFDGRGRVELKQGDHIKITASKYPFPTVCADKQSTDWFKSIQRTLRWNERERQKSFVVVEEDYHDTAAHDPNHAHTSDEEDDVSSDEFDIDDRSGGERTPDVGKPPEPKEDSDDEGAVAPSPPILAARKMRHLVEEYRSGVQSPDRFASNYHAPPPISQRHLLEALANVEKELKRVELSAKEAQTATEAEEADVVAPLPVDDMRRSDSDATLAPDRSRPPRQEGSTEERYGGRTPRQGRSRSRSAARSGSRSGSPQVGLKSKAFAFFGHDDSQSELSDGEEH